MLRAFATLEGIGRALDPDYKFVAVAQPYATQLLDLQVRPSSPSLGFPQLDHTAAWSCCCAMYLVGTTAAIVARVSLGYLVCTISRHVALCLAEPDIITANHALSRMP